MNISSTALGFPCCTYYSKELFWLLIVLKHRPHIHISTMDKDCVDFRAANVKRWSCFELWYSQYKQHRQECIPTNTHFQVMYLLLLGTNSGNDATSFPFRFEVCAVLPFSIFYHSQWLNCIMGFSVCISMCVYVFVCVCSGAVKSPIHRADCTTSRLTNRGDKCWWRYRSQPKCFSPLISP